MLEMYLRKTSSTPQAHLKHTSSTLSLYSLCLKFLKIIKNTWKIIFKEFKQSKNAQGVLEVYLKHTFPIFIVFKSKKLLKKIDQKFYLKF